MDLVELEINRENTLAFISERPTQISLTPVDRRERTASGGYIDVPGVPRPEQTFRIIETSSRSTPAEVRTQDGVMRTVAFWLLGAHDAQVAIGDHWVEGIREWEVGDIIRDNGYEIRALVAERGA